ncbi:MAG: glycoside hydrolase family 76 protein [Oscillospiraceae bacterium]|nr:glycoside hydrolase family 76 protein [Oscillospiraceae bacterium]
MILFFQRIVSFFVSLVLLIPGFFPMETAMRPSEAAPKGTAAERAAELADDYYRQYYRPGLHLLDRYAYSIAKPASCWEVTGLLSLSTRMAALDSCKYGWLLPSVTGCVRHFRRYDGLSFSGHVTEWTVFRGAAQRHSVSYDDMMWLGRDFVNMYRLTGNSRYISLAREIADYLIADAYVTLPDEIFTDQGWPAPDGPVAGYYWNEGKEAVHTCSTGPMAQFLAMFYNETEEAFYLEKSREAYRMLQYLENSDGTFHDLMRFHKDEDNNILGFKEHDLAVYTYNSGTPVSSAVELYIATGETAYLDDARHWAAAADRRFAQYNSENDIWVYPRQNTWFHLVLLSGYMDLLPFDDAAADYLARFRTGFDYAYENYRTAGHHGVMRNFMPRDFLNGFNANADYAHIAQDASSAAEIYAIYALLEQESA